MLRKYQRLNNYNLQ